MKESRFAREMREEGELEKATAYILNILRLRFGETAVSDVAAVVNSIVDVASLDSLHSLAVSCPTLDEFKARLPALQTTT